MNIIRLLILALVVWLIYRMVSRMLTKPRNGKPSTPELGTNMVRCAHCGIHLPENEAIYRDGQPYCSKEHRDSGPQ